MDKKYAEYLLNKTREGYNLIAEEFSITRKKMWEELRFLVDDYVLDGEKILDLGCGNGRLYEFFKDKNIDYIGVDNSEKLIELAKAEYPEGKFRLEDALALFLPSNYFDKVYSIAILHHIPSEEFRLQVLKEIKRVLKPEGLLILTVWKFHRLKDLLLLFKYTILKLIGKSKLDFRDIFKLWGDKKIKLYYHFSTKKELEKLLKEAGFKIKKIGVAKNKTGNRSNIYLIVEK